MESLSSPTISSFVVRFVIEPDSSSYRGEIRHIQTGEEILFLDRIDAVEFISRYVPLNPQDEPGAG